MPNRAFILKVRQCGFLNAHGPEIASCIEFKERKRFHLLSTD